MGDNWRRAQREIGGAFFRRKAKDLEKQVGMRTIEIATLEEKIIELQNMVGQLKEENRVLRRRAEIQQALLLDGRHVSA